MSFPADEHSFQFQHSRSSLAASYDILSQYLQSSVRLSIVTCFYGVQLGKQKGYLSMRNGFRSLDETVQSRRRELRVSCNGFHLKTSKKKIRLLPLFGCVLFGRNYRYRLSPTERHHWPMLARKAAVRRRAGRTSASTTGRLNGRKSSLFRWQRSPAD